MTTTIRQAWTTAPTIEASLDDREAIRRAIDDYLQGWFDADPERMAGAIHPRLAKFAVAVDRDRSAELDVSTFDEMVELTARGAGVARAGDGRFDVSILGVSGTIACAELRSRPYVEYLLLLRAAEGWRIVSTVWRWADGVGPRADG